MKKYLLLIAFLFCAVNAHAGKGSPSFTYEVGVDSITLLIVNVSSISATQMDNPPLINRVAMEIQNIDSSVNLWCSPSSTTVTSTNGRKIAPGNSWLVNFSDQSNANQNIRIYCINDSITATSKAAVTQGY